MNYRLILAVSLIVSVSFVVFVSAQLTLVSSPDSIKSYDAVIPISAGWNLVYGSFIQYDNSISSDSEIKKKDIKAVYYYSRKDSKYLQVYPSEQEFANYARTVRVNEDSKEIDYVMQSPYWVYSSKSGILKYNLKAIYMDDNSVALTRTSLPLSAGWNFITLSSQFNSKTISDFKGDCQIDKVYGFDSDWQDWSKVEFRDENVGLGMVVKVKNDCTLNVNSGNIVVPPSVPN